MTISINRKHKKELSLKTPAVKRLMQARKKIKMCFSRGCHMGFTRKSQNLKARISKSTGTIKRGTRGTYRAKDSLLKFKSLMIQYRILSISNLLRRS
jgi:predicted RNA-binding protein with RPS1 domain